MFQKLVRERPTIQEYWTELLEKGAIETTKGSIYLIRRPNGDKTLIVKDDENDILFHILSGRLEVTRSVSDLQSKYSFRVSKMGNLDPEDLDPAFDKYEGFEIALRDLYRTVDMIMEEHGKSQPPEKRAVSWLKISGNRIFLFALIVYAVLTSLVLFAR